MSNIPEVQGEYDVQFIDRKKYDVIFQNLHNISACLHQNEKETTQKHCDDELKILQKIHLKKLLNVMEICIYLGLGENTVRNLLNKPKNSYTVKVGNRLYANREMLDKWWNQCCGNYNGQSVL